MIFWVFFTFALWAISFPVGKFSATTGSVPFIIGTRLLVTSLLLLAWTLYKKKWSFSLTKSQFKSAFLLGILGYYITNIFELYGLERITSSKASLIYGLSPFFAAVLSYLKLKEKLSWKKFAGLAIGFLGIFPLFMTKGISGFGLSINFGDVAMFIATVTAMFGWVLLRHLVTDLSMHPLVANAWSMFFGAIACLVHAGVTDSWNPVPVSNPSGFLLGVIALIVISNIICSSMYSYLLKRFTVTFLSLAGMSSPLFAALWGWMFFHEPLIWEHLIGGGVMAIGLLIVYVEEIKLGYLGRQTS
jgi:drug/metabolite transporter (DMT)-like permease